MAKDDKTNVMRVLDGKKISYKSHMYEPDARLSGEEIAGILGEDADKVFKTLVTQGKTGQYYVFVIPVKEELDLKKAAKIFGEKKIEMLHVKDLLKTTGYIRGGCSPVGMKKQFKTVIDETALLFDKIYVSGGQRGVTLGVDPRALCAYIGAEFADVTV